MNENKIDAKAVDVFVATLGYFNDNWSACAALRVQGVDNFRGFVYATPPRVLPLLMVAVVDAANHTSRRSLTR